MAREKAYKRCATCKQALPRGSFAGTQWRRPDERSCRECTAERRKRDAKERVKRLCERSAASASGALATPSDAAAPAETSSLAPASLLAHAAAAATPETAVSRPLISGVSPLRGSSGSVSDLDLETIGFLFGEEDGVFVGDLAALTAVEATGPHGASAAAAAAPSSSSSSSSPAAGAPLPSTSTSAGSSGAAPYEEGDEEGDDTDAAKRSARNKKRRARMNLLFTDLAEVMGMKSVADRADVLDRALDTIKKLCAASGVSAVSSAAAGRAIISLASISAEPFEPTHPRKA